MAAQQAVFLAATRTDFALEGLLDTTNWPAAVVPDRFAEQMARQEAEYPLEQPYQLIKQVRLP